MRALLAALALAACLAFPALAPATVVSGPIAVNTTWTAAGSPYQLAADIVVMSGATLSMQPGTVVLGGGFSLRFQSGNLTATGAPGSPVSLGNLGFDLMGGTPVVRLERCRLTDCGSLTGAYKLTLRRCELTRCGDIDLDGQGSCLVENNRFDACQGILLKNVRANGRIAGNTFVNGDAVYIDYLGYGLAGPAINVDIERNAFMDNKGLLVASDDAVFVHVRVVGNSFAGWRSHFRYNVNFDCALKIWDFRTTSLLTVSGNTFLDPGRIALEADWNHKATIDARDNFWNAATAGAVAAKITDADDNPDYGAVLFEPYRGAPDPDAARALDGWWWQASAPGTGLSLEVQGDAAYLAWYVYDDAGRPVWLVALLTRSAEATFAGSLVAVEGPPLAGPWAGFSSQAVGQANLAFSDAAHGALSWSYGALAGQIPVTAFMPEFFGGQPDGRDLTGWWWDPAFPGMGLFVASHGGALYAAWYHYRDDRSPRWRSLGGDPGSFPAGATTYTGALLEFTGGQEIGGLYQPPAKTLLSAAALTVKPDGSGTLAWGGRTYNLERFEFRGY